MATTQQSKRPATTLRCGASERRSGKTSFGVNDLEALMNVAFEAKEWMTAHALKR